MTCDTTHTRHSPRAVWGVLAATITAVSLVLAACGGDEDNGSGAPGGDSAQIAKGEELYQANCASCHGSDLRGTNNGPSHLSVIYEPNHHGDEAFRSAIENGAVQHHWPFGDMPPVPGLSEADVDAIISYVRDVQEREGLE